MSVGSELVLSLDDFKAALKSVKDMNKAGSTSLLVQMTLSSTNDHGGSNLRNDGDSSAGDGVGSFDAANKKISGFCDDGINVEVYYYYHDCFIFFIFLESFDTNAAFRIWRVLEIFLYL